MLCLHGFPDHAYTYRSGEETTRMAKEMHVAGLSVPAGGAVRHSIEVAELADGSKITLPLLLINGAADGPRLYLGAAIHGDEVSGIAILSQAVSYTHLTLPTILRV